MSAITHDATAVAPRTGRTASGLAFALVAATTFGLSGALASGLLQNGWSAGLLVLARVGLGALVVVPFGVRALHGRWWLLRRNAGLLTAYGVVAVAGAQFCYFSSVGYLEVGPALLIEYTAPAAVVVWLWFRHAEPPTALTVGGALLAATGLVLVLDLVGGAPLDPVGVAWGLGAMLGCATFFVLSADETHGLPPATLAAGGLVVGALALGLLGAVGLLPLEASTAPASYADTSVAWWVPLVLLGLVTAAVPYTAGVAGARRLGSRLASFVSLFEVVAAIGFAWLLLGELPRPVQLAGGVLILAGVVTVRVGELRLAARVGPQRTPQA